MNNSVLLLSIFLILSLTTIGITKLFDIARIKIGHQKRLMLSTISHAVLLNWYFEIFESRGVSIVDIALCFAISYLILLEFLSLLYRAISLQILKKMLTEELPDFSQQSILAFYPHGGSNYVWKTRLLGTFHLKIITSNQNNVYLTKRGSYILHLVNLLVKIMHVRIPK